MTVSYPPDGQSTIFEARPVITNQPIPAYGQRKHGGRKSTLWRSTEGAPRGLEQAAVEWLDARAQGRSMVVVDAHLTAAIAAAAERA